MRVLQINNHHVVKGGSEKVYLETANLLNSKGHNVSFFSTNNAEHTDPSFVSLVDFSEPGLLSAFKNTSKFIYSKEAAYKLERIIKTDRPDVAHLHIFYGLLTSSILPILRKYQVPCVMSVHEYRIICPTYTLLDTTGKICDKCATHGYIHSVINKCNKMSYKYSAVSAAECYIRDRFFNYQKYIDHFIMVSQFCMDLHKKHRPGIEAKSTKLFNFVDVDQFSPHYEGGGYYLYVGRLSREKGVSTLISAAKTMPHVHFKIAGSGELKDELSNSAKNMSNVEFVGFVSGDRLASLIRNCRFLIVPSQWYENNPMSIIESFAYGKPVIGANIGGIPELVREYRTGFLFEPGNADSLLKAIHTCENLSNAEYVQISKNSREWAESNHSAESHYGSLINIYNSVICKRLGLA